MVENKEAACLARMWNATYSSLLNDKYNTTSSSCSNSWNFGSAWISRQILLCYPGRSSSFCFCACFDNYGYKTQVHFAESCAGCAHSPVRETTCCVLARTKYSCSRKPSVTNIRENAVVKATIYTIFYINNFVHYIQKKLDALNS